MINFRRNLSAQQVCRSIHIMGAILLIVILLLAVTAGCKRETGYRGG